MANTYKIRPLEKKQWATTLNDNLSLSCMIRIGDLPPNYHMTISTDNYASVGPIVSTLNKEAEGVGITLADKDLKRVQDKNRHIMNNQKESLEKINQRNFDDNLDDFHYNGGDD